MCGGAWSQARACGVDVASSSQPGSFPIHKGAAQSQPLCPMLMTKWGTWIPPGGFAHRRGRQGSRGQRGERPREPRCRAGSGSLPSAFCKRQLTRYGKYFSVVLENASCLLGANGLGILDPAQAVPGGHPPGVPFLQPLRFRAIICFGQCPALAGMEQGLES